MDSCYLCGKAADMEENIDGILVDCAGPCGLYIITQRAVDDFQKIHGRKQGAVDRVKFLRKRNKTRRIRISHEAVAFCKLRP